MFYWFCLVGKDTKYLRWTSLPRGKRVGRVSKIKIVIVIVEVKKKEREREKKISYMIDINNKWKKNEYEKKNEQGRKKNKCPLITRRRRKKGESKNQFNQSMVIGTNTLDHKTIKTSCGNNGPFCSLLLPTLIVDTILSGNRRCVL